MTSEPPGKEVDLTGRDRERNVSTKKLGKIGTQEIKTQLQKSPLPREGRRQSNSWDISHVAIGTADIFCVGLKGRPGWV